MRIWFVIEHSALARSIRISLRIPSVLYHPRSRRSVWNQKSSVTEPLITVHIDSPLGHSAPTVIFKIWLKVDSDCVNEIIWHLEFDFLSPLIDWLLGNINRIPFFYRSRCRCDSHLRIVYQIDHTVIVIRLVIIRQRYYGTCYRILIQKLKHSGFALSYCHLCHFIYLHLL